MSINLTMGFVLNHSCITQWPSVNVLTPAGIVHQSTAVQSVNLRLVTRELAFVLAALCVQHSETSERIISFSSLLRAGSIRYVFGVPTLLITYGRLVCPSLRTDPARILILVAVRHPLSARRMTLYFSSDLCRAQSVTQQQPVMQRKTDDPHIEFE